MMLKKMSVIEWNIGFINQYVDYFMLGNTDYSINWMQHQYRDRFFADPFLLKEDENNYIILAEEYLFTTQKGNIVQLVVDKNTLNLTERKMLIETSFHLSYPIVFNEYIIPEQYKSGKLIAYNYNGTEAKEMSNLGLIDATFLKDSNGEWVFASKKDSENLDPRKNLYRYKIVDGKVDETTELKIKESFNNSRCGGNFFEYNGHIYRPAQNSTENIYGESISLNEVIVNNDAKYEEKEITIIKNNGKKGYIKGLHTFNLAKNSIIIDGFKYAFHPYLKIKSKIKK